jgi:hypothetical protein
MAAAPSPVVASQPPPKDPGACLGKPRPADRKAKRLLRFCQHCGFQFTSGRPYEPGVEGAGLAFSVTGWTGRRSPGVFTQPETDATAASSACPAASAIPNWPDQAKGHATEPERALGGRRLPGNSLPPATVASSRLSTRARTPTFTKWPAGRSDRPGMGFNQSIGQEVLCRRPHGIANNGELLSAYSWLKNCQRPC